MIKVIRYVDGFNVYHALDTLSRATRGKKNYLKWVDLKKLMGIFTDRTVHEIVAGQIFLGVRNVDSGLLWPPPNLRASAVADRR